LKRLGISHFYAHLDGCVSCPFCGSLYTASEKPFNTMEELETEGKRKADDELRAGPPKRPKRSGILQNGRCNY
jgi:uncharacterized Zn finger protein (UPF0148 family)